MIARWRLDSGVTAENRSYLPGHRLDPNVSVTSEIGDTISGAQILVGAVPTARRVALFIRLPRLAFRLAPFLLAPQKDWNRPLHKRMSEVVFGVSRGNPHPPGVLSAHPCRRSSHRGEPTAVVLASRDASLAAELQEESRRRIFACTQ